MITDYKELETYSNEKFKRLTGIHKSIFRKMVKVVFEKQRVHKLGGRPWKLSIPNQVLLMLGYYREYVTLFSLGCSFKVGEATAWRTVTTLEKMLLDSGEFRLPGKQAARRKDNDSLALDASEHPIERPKKKTLDDLKIIKKNTSQEKRKNTL
jgi:hypothetical protein